MTETLANLDFRKALSISFLVRLLMSVAILAIGHNVGRVAQQAVRRFEENKNQSISKKESSQSKSKREHESVRLTTVFLGSLVYYTVLVSSVILAANVIGIKVAGFIAWAGAFAVLLGLALQGVLSDVSSGFLLALTQQFNLGDILQIPGIRSAIGHSGNTTGNGEVVGTVTGFNLFYTTLTDFDTRSTVTIPNRKLQDQPFANLSKNEHVELVVDVELPNSSITLEMLFARLQSAASSFPEVIATGKPAIVGVGEIHSNFTSLRVRCPILIRDFEFETVGRVRMRVKSALATLTALII
jgi:small-conductance mechanosensitive channel